MRECSPELIDSPLNPRAICARVTSFDRVTAEAPHPPGDAGVQSTPLTGAARRGRSNGGQTFFMRRDARHAQWSMRLSCNSHHGWLLKNT